MPDNNEFSHLAGTLNVLLDMLKQGNWDELSDLEAALVPALNAVRTPGLLHEKNINRKQVEELLTKLELAIKACSVRKEQIAPLVNALSANKHISTTP